ncbi:CIA30 family protein [Phaeodactylibacter luteus]|uniref:CIA30 family protein n=1 Tax=Phaeodactylibacter luteus TaxID=1564516 RepID=A0A5C6S3K6_9BACT|nr:CIA30 family protein [Phaeodactylibacter luteus]TXB69418.1 CIA30 family protein [Phaeodactylibacter luteus]
MTPSTLMLTSFQQGLLNWVPINDTVMGGLSQSRFETIAGEGIFSGRVSLDNSGGFASVKAGLSQMVPLHNFRAIRISYCPDGKAYDIRLRVQEEQWAHIAYRFTLPPSSGTWQTADCPLDEFSPTFRGRHKPEAPALSSLTLSQVGFLISQRQAGPFEFRVRQLLLIGG